MSVIRTVEFWETAGSLVPAALDLFEGLVDEALVVFLGQVPLDDLGGDHHG